MRNQNPYGACVRAGRALGEGSNPMYSAQDVHREGPCRLPTSILEQDVSLHRGFWVRTSLRSHTKQIQIILKNIQTYCKI